MGPIVLPVWAGSEFIDAAPAGFVVNRLTLAALSLYFSAHIRLHLSQTLGLGAAPVNRGAKVIFAESPFFLFGAAFILTTIGSRNCIYLAMAVGIKSFPSWMYPVFSCDD